MEGKIKNTLKTNFDNLVGTILFLALYSSASFAIYESYKFNAEEKKYCKYVTPFCQKVMKKFDENHDGMLDPQEGSKLAQAVGYNKTIPSSDITVNLSSYDNYKRRLVKLTIKSESGHRTGQIMGISSYEPTFSDWICFPLSRLEELARE